MRHGYYLLALLVCASSAVAQISISQNDILTTKGTPITYSTHGSQDFTGLSAVISSTGSGKTWDLTNRTYSFTDSTTVTYLDYPSNAPQASSYTASNLVHKQVSSSASGTVTNWSFYKIETDKLSFYGVVNVSSSGTVNTGYATPVQSMKFPAALNTTWTTQTSITVQGFTSNLTFEYTVDGEGTVVTPEGSFPCLRLKLKLTTSVLGFNTINNTYTFLDKNRTYATIGADGNNAPASIAYWRQASGGGGQQPTAPATPTLALPADGAAGVATNPTLSWGAVSGATSYTLQVSANASFSSFVYNQSNIAGTSQQVTGLSTSTMYYWRVSATNAGGTSAFATARNFTTSAPSAVEAIGGLPEEFSLLQNYPNPFNPSTNFEFRIAEPGFVRLTVVDMLGREIATLVNENLTPGTYRTSWDASGMPSGVYLYQLRAEGKTETKRMTLLK